MPPQSPVAEDIPRERLEKLAKAQRILQMREEVQVLEGSLIEFYKAAWEVMDPAPYQHNWHLDAIAEHLEAISYGWIRKLCVNLPPRHSKTLLVSVCWNAWLWCRAPDEKFPLLGPGGRMMCLSYADTLSMDNAVLARRLVESPWYQARWGHRVMITEDQDAKNKFDTTAGGTRISGSFKGSVTGRGAGIRVYDDPHKMTEVESQPIREGVLRLYDTTLKSRITDPRTSAEVLVAQRGHQDDLSSKFLDSGDVVHLNLPAEYDPGRHCVTVLKWDEAGQPERTWEDPRTEEGERLWANRFGTKELAQYKKNPYEWQAQWQQAPVPRGGGLFKEHWIQGYEVPTGGSYNFVPKFVLASLDTAFKENEENDYNALSIWYVYDDPKTKARKLLLADAWKKRLPLHGDRVERQPDESEKSYLKRASPKWGLVEWVNFTCMKRRVNRLIIEDSARGHDLTAELRRVFGGRNYGVRLVKPRGGDKWARAHAVVDLFTDEMIYAPGEWVGNEWRWRDWFYDVLNELCGFPRMTHDDMVDSIVQALRHLRECGLAIRREERELADEIASRYKQPERPLYEV